MQYSSWLQLYARGLSVMQQYRISFVEMIQILLEHNFKRLSSPVTGMHVMQWAPKRGVAKAYTIPTTGFIALRPPHGLSSRMQSLEPKIGEQFKRISRGMTNSPAVLMPFMLPRWRGLNRQRWASHNATISRTVPKRMYFIFVSSLSEVTKLWNPELAVCHKT